MVNSNTDFSVTHGMVGGKGILAQAAQLSLSATWMVDGKGSRSLLWPQGDEPDVRLSVNCVG